MTAALPWILAITVPFILVFIIYMLINRKIKKTIVEVKDTIQEHLSKNINSVVKKNTARFKSKVKPRHKIKNGKNKKNN